MLSRDERQRLEKRRRDVRTVLWWARVVVLVTAIWAIVEWFA